MNLLSYVFTILSHVFTILSYVFMIPFYVFLSPNSHICNPYYLKNLHVSDT